MPCSICGTYGRARPWQNPRFGVFSPPRLRTAPFAASRAACLALLERSENDPSVTDDNGDAYQTALVFARLLMLSDDEVMRILTLVMAETLAAGSAMVEAVGVHL